MDTANFTTDTRKDYCPIRIMYAAADPAAGPVHTSELDLTPWGWPHAWSYHPLAIIKATELSDYSGSTVEASNYVCLQELSVKEPGAWPLVQIYGSHGYQALAYDATLGPVPPTWELCNALDGFENHDGIFDDDHHSALEAELEAEAWDDYGRKDFRKALVSLLDSMDSDHDHEIPDDDQPAPVGILDDTAGDWDGLLTGLWHTGCDKLNVNGGSGHIIETGCTVHFYIDEWCDKAGRDRRYLAKAEMLAIIALLAKATRTEG